MKPNSMQTIPMDRTCALLLNAEMRRIHSLMRAVLSTDDIVPKWRAEQFEELSRILQELHKSMTPMLFVPADSGIESRYLK